MKKIDSCPQTRSLEIASALADRGFWVFPMAVLQDGRIIPFRKGWQEKATLTPAAPEAEWPHIETQVGIFAQQVGPNREPMLVVDVDVKTPGKNGADSVFDWAMEGKVLPDTFRVNTPSGGWHLYYKAPYMVKSSVGRVAPGVDIRSSGGLVVAPGSKKANGKEYTIGLDLPLAEAPAWLVEACGRPGERPTGDGAGSANLADVDSDAALSRSRSFLEKCEPVAEHGGRNDKAYRLALQLRDFGVPEEDAVEVLNLYWNERNDPPLGDDELASAVRNAFRYAHKPAGALAPEHVFEPPKLPTTSPAEDVNTPTNDDSCAEDPIGFFNKNHAFIRVGAKHRILYDSMDSFGNRIFDLVEEHTFHADYASTEIHPDGKRPMKATKLWMESPRRRTYSGIVFHPESETPQGFLNLWRGFRHTGESEKRHTPAAQAALADFLAHVKDNICRGDNRLYEYVIKWTAGIVQRPETKPHAALVIRGLKGTGKSFFAEVIGGTIGRHLYTQTADNKGLLGQFNANLANRLLIVAEETHWAGDRSADGVLKHLITGDTMEIEKKGVDRLTVKNYARVIIIGNEEWVAPASLDERRFCVLEIGNGRREDKAFFGGIMAGMAAGGYEALMHHLLHEVDISAFYDERVPNTEALAAQKLRSMSLVGKWWFGFLQDCPLAGGFPKTLSVSDSYALLRDFARKMNASSRLPEEYLLPKQLQQFCPVIEVVRERGRLHMSLPSLEAARKDFEGVVGWGVEWLGG